MTFRDFLKDLEGQELYYVPDPATGQHVLSSVSSALSGKTKCTLLRVEEDFVVLDFKKDGMFSAPEETLYISINAIYCSFPPAKK